MRKIPEASPTSRPSPQFRALHPDPTPHPHPDRCCFFIGRLSLSALGRLPEVAGDREATAFFWSSSLRMELLPWRPRCRNNRFTNRTSSQAELESVKAAGRLRGRRVSYCVREIKTVSPLLKAKSIFRMTNGQLGCFHFVLVLLGLEPPFLKLEKRIDKTSLLNFLSPGVWVSAVICSLIEAAWNKSEQQHLSRALYFILFSSGWFFGY